MWQDFLCSIPSSTFLALPSALLFFALTPGSTISAAWADHTAAVAARTAVSAGNVAGVQVHDTVVVQAPYGACTDSLQA